MHSQGGNFGFTAALNAPDKIRRWSRWSRPALHMQSLVGYIIGTHESSFRKRQGFRSTYRSGALELAYLRKTEEIREH